MAMCKNLTSLDLSMFNTSSTTDMWHMFNGDTNLKTLNISKFTFTNVTDYTAIFRYLPTKAQGMQVYVKDSAARTWILNLNTSTDRPSDWDTTNVIIAS